MREDRGQGEDRMKIAETKIEWGRQKDYKDEDKMNVKAKR